MCNFRSDIRPFYGLFRKKSQKNGQKNDHKIAKNQKFKNLISNSLENYPKINYVKKIRCLTSILNEEFHFQITT